MEKRRAIQINLEREFQERGIFPLEPGFYDHPKFVEAEKKDSDYLKQYARYVEALTFEEDYLERVRNTVVRLSDYLYSQLKLDGRKGACVDISGAFARMLDEEKIWAYPVGGGVGIKFPSTISDSYFGAISIPGTPVTAGHMWVRVPPYRVVDISLALQPWEREKEQHLPARPALSESSEPCVATPFELLDMDYIRWVRSNYGEEPSVTRIVQNYPWVASMLTEFPCTAFSHGELRLSYVPVAVKMSEQPIGGMKEPTLNGMSPLELYESFKVSMSTPERRQ